MLVVFLTGVSFMYFVLGVILVFGSQQSLLVVLFSLEVLFFGVILSLVGVLSLVSVYFLLLLVVFSGVLGLCLFISSTSLFSLEVCSTFLD